ncbi:MAG: dihydrodipicolinate synthase family protein [Planctomycetes bacterium]|nr:dihydrodipicolinate synthase family protein [Planctomycetota bacterium]MBL7037502.1 dihydrodipicolinate synthase family protein [Pirellulaceae bacterium]
MPETISGVLPVVHTPFLEDESIDYESLARQIEWAFAQGAHGYCTGMVSELLRLSTKERVLLNETLAEANAGRGVFIAGVGAESTRQAIEYAQAAEDSGCDAIMAIPPISTALPPRELLGYFSTLAEHVDLPLVVQDASSYVGQPIPQDVCVRLLDDFGPDRVLFKPEAAPVGPNLSALRDSTGGQAQIFDGSGGVSLVDCYRRGIVGTMPGMEFLSGIVALWKALERDDEQATYDLYLPICALVSLQLQAGLDGFLAIEKYVLAKRGLFATDVRRKPHAWEMDEETRLELERLLGQLDEAIQRVTGERSKGEQ